MQKSDPPIVVEHAFNVETQKVWEAISKVDQMTQWFFENVPDFQARTGFSTEFPVHSGERIFTHCWEVTEVVPMERLTYRWRYKEYPGDSFVNFQLVSWIDWTLLRVTATITQDFPPDIPEFQRESCIGGWTYFLKERLKAYLEG